MIGNKNKYIILNILIICLLIIGLVNQDLFFDNYSRYATYLKGYIYLIIVALLMTLSNYLLSHELNKKYILISILSFLIPAIIPFSNNEYLILKDIHIIFAYIGFFLSIINRLLNFIYFKTYDYKLGNYLSYLFTFVVVLVLMIYLKYQVVNFLLEFIYITVYIFINVIMYLKMRY